MLPIIAGTIRSTVKLAEMDNKWQQKKKNNKIFEKGESDPLTRQIQKFKDDLEKMRENSKLSDISAKVKAGSSLTSEELEYLQRNNPSLYQEYLEVRNEKEAYKRQLKSCRTKEDVEKLKLNKMASYMAEAKSVMNNPNIPEGKKLELMEKLLKKTMGVQKVHMDFVQSSEYLSLPTEEELAEEAKDKVEQKEEAAEDIREGALEDAEAVESTDESDDSGDKVKVKLPELKKQADDSFETVKEHIINYIGENRPSGYGLEFLKDDFTEEKKHK